MATDATESKKTAQKRYRERNREKLNNQAKKWREENYDRWIASHRALRSTPEYQEREKIRVKKSRKENPFKFVLQRARYRARELGLEYDLDREYVESIWTGKCPIFNTEIQLGTAKNSVPKEHLASLDRIDNSLGYIKGNVHFVSYRANWLKTNSNFSEIEQLYTWWKCYDVNHK